MSNKHLRFYIIAFLTLTFGFSYRVFAKGKLDISTGYYIFQAETDTETKELANFGVSRILYRSGLFRNFEFGLGYSLLLTKIISGDMSYGPDIGIYYYPITQPDIDVQSGASSVWLSSLFRPFVGGSFHQRQFQSVQSSYAGFGLSFGSEYNYSKELMFKGEFRYMLLQGPSAYQANQMDLLLGITLPF